MMSIYKCLLSRDIDINDTHSSERVNGKRRDDRAENEEMLIFERD